MRNRTHRVRTRCAASGERGISTIARIGAQIQPQPDGCWLWCGKADDYGRPSDHGRTLLVHRYVYQILVGPIPDGYHLHHICQRPGCCNPAHLIPLTPKEHVAAHR